MLRVFLDQNHWISFVRMEIGRPGYERLRPIFDLAVRAKDRGKVSFPLSEVRYIETWNNPTETGRRDIARTMIALARRPLATGPDTMISRTQAIHMELDFALMRRFGRPVVPRVYPVFGQGLHHVFSRGDAVCRCTREDEEHWLAPTDAEIAAIAPFRDAWRAEAAALVARDQAFIQGSPSLGMSKQGRQDYLRWRLIGDLKDAIPVALSRAGITTAEFDALGHDGWAALIDDMRSFRVDHDLQVLRHQNPQHPRHVNDLGDIHALSVAVADCDVVVTEGLWADFIKRSGLDRRYGTIMLSNVTELMPILLRAA